MDKFTLNNSKSFGLIRLSLVLGEQGMVEFRIYPAFLPQPELRHVDDPTRSNTNHIGHELLNQKSDIENPNLPKLIDKN